MLVSRSHTHTHTHTHTGNSGADRHVRPAESEASVAVERPEKARRTLLNISELKDICKQEPGTKRGLLEMSRTSSLSIAPHDK